MKLKSLYMSSRFHAYENTAETKLHVIVVRDQRLCQNPSKLIFSSEGYSAHITKIHVLRKHFTCLLDCDESLCDFGL